MKLSVQFTPITLEDVPSLAAKKKEENSRFVQILAVNTEAGIDLIYSFMKDGALANYKVEALQKDSAVVPSITDKFLEAFVFENEIHDLFGVDIRNIAIDFGGHFYALAQKEPMTIISPAQKEAREKAAKLARAKAERARKASAANASYAESHPGSKPSSAPISPDVMDDFDEKLKGMSPEKLARVKAAMAAKARKAQQETQEKNAMREQKLAEMDPEKAARVKAAMEAKAKRNAAKPGLSNVQEEAELEAKLSQLDPERAAKVIAAIDAKDIAHQAQLANEEIEAQRAALEKKLEGMDPARADKVRAAFEAKIASQSSSTQSGKDGE